MRDFKDNNPSEKYIRLEELVALAVSPFLKPATMLKMSNQGATSPLTRKQEGSRTLPRSTTSASTLVSESSETGRSVHWLMSEDGEESDLLSVSSVNSYLFVPL